MSRKKSSHVKRDADGRKVMQVATPQAKASALVERFGIEGAATIAERRHALTKPGSYFDGYWNEVGMWIDSIESERRHAASQALHEHEQRVAEEEAAP